MARVRLNVKQKEGDDLAYPIVYDVIQIKNTTRWKIGQRLTKQQVDSIIETLKVEVIIQ